MEALDDCLKRSTHFADIVNTHRTAMAEVIAAIICPMVVDGTVDTINESAGGAARL
jgi:hypothetical protein